MADMIQIKNTVVDANNWVSMQGATFTPGYKKRVSTNPLDGQFTGTNYVIAKGDRTGVENPSISIQGVLSTHDYSVSDDFWSTTPSTITSVAEDGTSMVGSVTMGYLLALWSNMTGDTYLKISFGNPSNQLNWKNADLTTAEIPVEVIAVTPKPRQDSTGNHFIDYTIEFREVRPT